MAEILNELLAKYTEEEIQVAMNKMFDLAKENKPNIEQQ